MADTDLPSVKENHDVISLSPVRDICPEVPITATIKDVKIKDLELANMQLCIMAEAWKEVRTISGICRLSRATFDAIEGRRKVLMIPYGVESKASKGDIVELLD